MIAPFCANSRLSAARNYFCYFDANRPIWQAAHSFWQQIKRILISNKQQPAKPTLPPRSETRAPTAKPNTRPLNARLSLTLLFDCILQTHNSQLLLLQPADRLPYQIYIRFPNGFVQLEQIAAEFPKKSQNFSALIP